VLPRGFHAGYVKITGMKGEQPKEIQVDNAIIETSQKTEEVITTTPVSKISPNPPSDLDHDSTSFDDMDTTSNSKPGRSVLCIVHFSQFLHNDVC
jgi:pre-mRNA cleavage complex 2 protein Pcf11